MLSKLDQLSSAIEVLYESLLDLYPDEEKVIKEERITKMIAADFLIDMVDDLIIF